MITNIACDYGQFVYFYFIRINFQAIKTNLFFWKSKLREKTLFFFFTDYGDKKSKSIICSCVQKYEKCILIYRRFNRSWTSRRNLIFFHEYDYYSPLNCYPIKSTCHTSHFANDFSINEVFLVVKHETVANIASAA